jgi:hypothetical protein
MLDMEIQCDKAKQAASFSQVTACIFSVPLCLRGEEEP